ncbi:uncharacterized protein A1O5_10633 [Cladophialophora psammophila CBS 110553]|uniref:Amino acid transporter n=1 Tax=Cladophialophora psammophila CBS 110553 TaxID=1182543 RepID=W9WPA1_9EURO|nr:uncharacterized protein A1O5_10633 [Cladophialophora psammophila CBS 110553]EXJ66481.1 hypothetical protein A1O5_10633 [Cladophialophora psammophila CBS 110553]
MEMDGSSLGKEKSAICTVSPVEQGLVLDIPVKRDMGWMGILAAGFSISNSWLVFLATLVIPLVYGPMTTICGIFSVTIAYIPIGLTIAEFISAYPTTGGQYHWTSILAPPSVKRVASYMTGFLSWCSWLTITASTQSAMAMCIFAIVINAKPTTVIHKWEYFLIFQGQNITAHLINLLFQRHLTKLYFFGFLLSLVAIPVISVTLLATSTKASSEFVWTTVVADYGWPTGVQFLFALTAPVQAFCAVDGAVHLVEEVNQAGKIVPRTVVTSLVISFASLILLACSVLYAITDLYAVLATPSGFLVFEIVKQGTGSAAAAIVFTVLLLLAFPVSFTACARVASVMGCSLGRDNILIYSEKLSMISQRFNVPVYALFVDWILISLIGFLYLASPLAFNAIIGVSGIFQQLTIAIPTFFLIYRLRSPSVLPKDRSFRLPSWLGWTCNIFTVVWAAVTTIFFLFPFTEPIAEATMSK